MAANSSSLIRCRWPVRITLTTVRLLPLLRDDDALDTGNYSYHVTFYDSGSFLESRPTSEFGALSVSSVNGRIRIDNLPQPTSGDFNSVRIYRNLANDTSEFHLLAELPIGETTYIDNVPDADILAVPQIDLMGPKAGTSTLLANVGRNSDNYSTPFEPGVLTFEGQKGDRTLSPKQMTITSTTTVGQLIEFMDQAFGIDDIGGSAGGAITETVSFSSPATWALRTNLACH